MSRTERTRANGIEFAYRLEGPAGAPAVVLHHPLATDLSFWDETTAGLVKDYRVLRFDARGHGASAAPVGPYGFETLAADTVGLMDAVGIRRAAFVGLSMGGMVGQYLGLLHPGRFSCLALVSTNSRVPPEMRSLWSDRVVAARRDGMGPLVEASLARWLAETARRTRPDLVDRCRRMIEATPVEGYAGWCGAIERLDVTDRLGGIRLPTLVVVGEEDPATPPVAARVIHEHIPGSQLSILPGVSHMLAIENPGQFLSVLTSFLAGHRAD